MKLAYVTNQYPHPSHTFIRREIEAVEATGVEVQRYSIRHTAGPQQDPQDEAERLRTFSIIGAGPLALLLAFALTAARSPLQLLRAAALAFRIGWRSDRGLLRHFAYLVEASLLARSLRASGAEHLHAHFGTNPAAVAMLCRELGGPPYSFTVHGPEEFDKPEFLALRDKIKRAAFVVAISEYGKSQLCRWADQDDWSKLFVVRCGLPRSFLQAPASPAPLAGKLVAVGRFAEQKGQLVLLQAAGRLRAAGIPFELTLVGDGPMRGQIEAEIARLGLSGQVRLTGWLEELSVRHEMLQARALILPSFAEGLPVVAMEALALGRPVVATQIAGVPELVEQGITGWLVPAGSVERLAAGLRAALSASPADLDALGRVGAARVAQQHDGSHEAAKLLALVEGARLPAPMAVRALAQQS